MMQISPNAPKLPQGIAITAAARERKNAANESRQTGVCSSLKVKTDRLHIVGLYIMPVVSSHWYNEG